MKINKEVDVYRSCHMLKVFLGQDEMELS